MMRSSRWVSFQGPFRTVVLATTLFARGAFADDPAEPDQDPPRPSDAKSAPDPKKPAEVNPLELRPEVRQTIGSDFGARLAPPEGELNRTKYFPYYEESKGDYRLRTLPPFFIEHTRGLGTDKEDQESLYGALYYRRRSPKVDADVFFPLFWNIRDGENRVTVVGPWMHREAPQEHDNWLAPIYFQGSRKVGGYFHAPLLLTTSSWDQDAAFTIAGPYFRVRKKDNVDAGIFPLYFHGESGSIGTHKSYTLIPPLLTYVRTDELENTRFAVHGPVILSSSPKRESLSVFPLYFQIRGKPETGGIRESHTTLFPLFHYGETDTESLFATPLYLRRKTPSVDTLLTPLFSHATTRKGRTSLYAAGPIVPIFFHYTDEDTTERTTALAPFFYSHSSPERSDFMTPLFGTFDRKGVSRTTWIFPTITSTATNRGYLNAFHPIFYNSKSDADSFTMAALLYWDFNSPKARSTVAFPLFWRFADKDLGSVTQVAGNTLYLERKVEGGSDWEFHFLPIFSYGKKPNGHFWNILFGLTGYQSEGSYSRIKLLWIPIQTGGPSASAK